MTPVPHQKWQPLRISITNCGRHKSKGLQDALETSCTVYVLEIQRGGHGSAVLPETSPQQMWGIWLSADLKALANLRHQRHADHMLIMCGSDLFHKVTASLSEFSRLTKQTGLKLCMCVCVWRSQSALMQLWSVLTPSAKLPCAKHTDHSNTARHCIAGSLRATPPAKPIDCMETEKLSPTIWWSTAAAASYPLFAGLRSWGVNLHLPRSPSSGAMARWPGSR